MLSIEHWTVKAQARLLCYGILVLLLGCLAATHTVKEFPTHPQLPAPLRVDDLTDLKHIVQPHMRTSGINHILGVTTQEEDVFSPSLDFHFTFHFDGRREQGQATSCAIGFRKDSQAGTRIDPGYMEVPVSVFRFAADGTIARPQGGDISWLVRMPDGQPLRGELKIPLDQEGKQIYPAELTLRGRMLITLQSGDGEPLNLMSEGETTLLGSIADWPPRGAALALAEPLAFFPTTAFAPVFMTSTHERKPARAEPSAPPYLTVLAMETRIGTTENAFLSICPDITKARILMAGKDGNPRRRGGEGPAVGLRVTWNDTRTLMAQAKSLPVEGYHVYRNYEPDDLDGWRMIARVALPDTFYIDPNWDGTRTAAYLVLSTTSLKFGYPLEGSPGNPYKIKKITD